MCVAVQIKFTNNLPLYLCWYVVNFKSAQELPGSKFKTLKLRVRGVECKNLIENPTIKSKNQSKCLKILGEN